MVTRRTDKIQIRLINYLAQNSFFFFFCFVEKCLRLTETDNETEVFWIKNCADYIFFFFFFLFLHRFEV